MIRLSTDIGSSLYSLKTRRFLYPNKNADISVHASVPDYENKTITILCPGNSYQEKVLMKEKLEYHASKMKVENPGIAREDIMQYMEGIRDGLDHSEAMQHLPPYPMDLESRIQRAQALSSQLDEVKRLFPEEGCIPAHLLREADELLNMKRYDEKLDRLHDKLYGNHNEAKQE